MLGLRSSKDSNLTDVLVATTGMPCHSQQKTWSQPPNTVLYRQGSGFDSLAHLLNRSMLPFITGFKPLVKRHRTSLWQESAVEEIDKVNPYIRSTKTTAGSGLLLTELGGDLLAAYWAAVIPRQNDRAIQDKDIERLRADYWDLDQHFVPEEMQRQLKARIDTVEGYNSWFHHLLAQLRGKTKCDGQSQTMLQYCE